MDFYHARRLLDSLYRPQHVRVAAPLPVLFSDELDVFTRLEGESDEVISMEDLKRYEFGVNQRLIRKRQSQGFKLFDGELLHAAEIKCVDGKIDKIVAKRASYFSYTSSIDRVERRLLRPGLKRWSLDSRRFSTARAAIQLNDRPLWIAGNAVTVFNTKDGPLVPVHHRSSTVMSGHGTYTVVPTFGMESAAVGSRRSPTSILLYNYAKEFGEELFDLDQVIESALNRESDPDAIFRYPEVGLCREAFRTSRMRLYLTGYMIYPRDETLGVSLLAVFDDGVVSDLLGSMRANFEAARSADGQAAIQLVGLFSEQFDQWAEEGAMYPTAIFALDRARQHFASSSSDGFS